LFCFIKLYYVFGCKLCESSLLPVCWMLEASMGSDGGVKKRVQLDCGLLAALVDMWRVEMSRTCLNFPLPRKIGVVDLPDTWRVNLKNRFDWGGMVPEGHQGFEHVPDQISPTKKWVLQYNIRILQRCCNVILFLCLKLKIVDNCITDYEDPPATMSRYLEVYLLWLIW
jgi:hypothetical protein